MLRPHEQPITKQTPQYKMIVAYDGTDYAGWAPQKHMTGIANVLQDTFAQAFKSAIHTKGVSRTDAGVHAMGQVVTFRTPIMVHPESLIRAWNNLLPRAIIIRSLKQVATDFHLHANIDEKMYHYHVSLKRPLPFLSRFVYHYPQPISREKLERALHVFIGTHDFRSFSTGYERESTIRTIHNIQLEYFARFGIYRIIVQGPAFLHHMVRRIVGASLDVAARDRLSEQTLVDALAMQNPQTTLPNAPAHGLVLHRIIYKEQI